MSTAVTLSQDGGAPSVAEIEERPMIGTLTEKLLDELVRDIAVRQALAPGDPDFTFYAHADNGRYFFRAFDAGPRMSWRCTGRTPNMPQHASLLYGVHCALSSINESTLSERLCQRYGFSSRRAARQSLRKLKVAISVTDEGLAELGQALADAEDPRALLGFMNEADARRYAHLVQQIRRFETRWRAVPAEHQKIIQIRQWAADLIPRVLHDGEVQSPRRPAFDWPGVAVETAKDAAA